MANKAEQTPASASTIARRKPRPDSLTGAFGLILQAVLKPKPGGPGKTGRARLLREIDRETDALRARIAGLDSLARQVRTLQAAEAKKAK